MARENGRASDQLRPVTIEPGFFPFAEGSALIRMGETQVACAATIEERVPPFLRGAGKGWITAEYGMLPRSTLTRTSRERNSTGGRTQEIQRLIGRSLRSVADLPAMGERTVTVDCDVLRADGGTRTAAITAAYVAVYQAMLGLVRNRVLFKVPLPNAVAAVSVGMVDGGPLLDLCYEEDFRADVDCNVVMADSGEFVEFQATGESQPFSREDLGRLTDLAVKGTARLFELQQQVVTAL